LRPLAAAADWTHGVQETRDALTEALLPAPRTLRTTGDWRSADPLAAEARQCVGWPSGKKSSKLINDKREEEGATRHWPRAHLQVVDKSAIPFFTLDGLLRCIRSATAWCSYEPPCLRLPPAERAGYAQAYLAGVQSKSPSCRGAVRSGGKGIYLAEIRVLRQSTKTMMTSRSHSAYRRKQSERKVLEQSYVTAPANPARISCASPPPGSLSRM